MKKIFLFLILTFVFPLFISAENKIVFEDENVEIIPGGTYDIDIKVISDDDFDEVDFGIITTSSLIKLYNVKINEEFINSDNKDYVLKSKTKQKSGTVVATLTLKVDNNVPIGTTGFIKITNPKLTSDKKYNLDIATLNVTVKEEIKSNLLASLSSTIAPFEFNNDKFEYEVKVDDNVDEFDLVAEAEDSKAVVNISSQKLSNRKNIINVKVSRDTLEDKTYKVVVIKNIKEDNSKKIVRNSSSDKKTTSMIKNKWLPIIVSLVALLIVDLFFVKKNK